MHLFLTARLERLPFMAWKTGGGQTEASHDDVTSPPTPSLPHRGRREALDLTPWRNLLRELAP